VFSGPGPTGTWRGWRMSQAIIAGLEMAVARIR
jgi:hypothetical protein